MAKKHIEDFIPKDMDSLFLSVANLNMDYAARMDEDPKLPNPDLYMYYDGLKNRTVWLDDLVDETTAIPITKMILAWNREDNEKNIPIESRKPIKLFIYLRRRSRGNFSYRRHNRDFKDARLYL